jgi:hypothetical protein
VLAIRQITTLDDYNKMATDLTALKMKHARFIRMPATVQTPATVDNFAIKAAELQKVAQARLDRLNEGCSSSH